MDEVPGLLKAFVIGGGVLLVAGMLLLATLLVVRVSDGDEDARPGVSGSFELLLPKGARIERIVPDGDERVLLLGVAGDGEQFLAVIDPETGERLSLIRFRATADDAPVVER